MAELDKGINNTFNNNQPTQDLSMHLQVFMRFNVILNSNTDIGIFLSCHVNIMRQEQ